MDLEAIFQADADFQLARLLIARGDYRAGLRRIEQARKVIADNPELNAWHAFLTWHASGSRDASAVLSSLTACECPPPAGDAVLEMQARVLMKLGRLGAARAILETILQRSMGHRGASSAMRRLAALERGEDPDPS